MSRTPVTEGERDRIRELHGQGMSANAIARELGRSPATITNHCAQMGLSFDRSRVIEANRARRADAETRRRELADALLDDAERIRQRMWAQHESIQYVGRDGNRVVDRLTVPPPHEQLALARTVGILATQHAKLVAMDDDGGLSGALDGLRSLGSAITALAGGGDDDEHGGD